MADQLECLIEALENTETYDRENSLIEIYVYLVSQKCFLPQKSNTLIFIELSKWRDCSLGDGVASYYEMKDADALLQLEDAVKKYDYQEICTKFISGIHTYQEKGNLDSLDDWIFDNEWGINDFLTELTGPEKICKSGNTVI